MHLRFLLCGFLVVLVASMGALSVQDAFAAQHAGARVKLLEPLGEEKDIPVKPGAGTLIAYFNSAVTWLISVAVGICVIWVLIGGFHIMVSGGDTSLRQRGQEFIKWALIGLVMLLFAGFILRTLNQLFFK